MNGFPSSLSISDALHLRSVSQHGCPDPLAISRLLLVTLYSSTTAVPKEPKMKESVTYPVMDWVVARISRSIDSESGFRPHSFYFGPDQRNVRNIAA